MARRNPSWIEALEAEHARLGALLERLGKLVRGSGDAGKRAEVTALLREVASHVRQHMRFEEDSGYLAEVLQRRPNESAAVEQLRREHDNLQEELAQLGRAVSGAPGAIPETTLSRLREWVVRMHEHEHRENALMQDAFNADLGAAD